MLPFSVYVDPLPAIAVELLVVPRVPLVDPPAVVPLVDPPAVVPLLVPPAVVPLLVPPVVPLVVPPAVPVLPLLVPLDDVAEPLVPVLLELFAPLPMLALVRMKRSLALEPVVALPDVPVAPPLAPDGAR